MDIFCKIINGEMDSLCVYEDDVVKCIMDAFPNSPGHTLILPKVHYSTTLDIPDDVLVHVHKIEKMLIKRMEERLDGIVGVHIGINYGEPQAVKHYHMHLIPVYKDKLDKTQEEICEILKRA